ncbi:MAG: YggT family protein [Clostridia bacterium]|nr:YggT family protein [Clostridia bacterium]
MSDIVSIFGEIVDILLQAAVWLWLLRCIFSLIGAEEEGPLICFAVFYTEIFITPMRVLFDRMGWSDDMIIDMPGMISIFIVAMVDMLF